MAGEEAEPDASVFVVRMRGIGERATKVFSSDRQVGRRVWSP